MRVADARASTPRRLALAPPPDVRPLSLSLSRARALRPPAARIQMERPARIIGKKGRAQLSSGGLVPGMPRPVRVGPVQVWPLYPSMPEPLKPVVKELQFLGKFVGKLWDLVNAPITFD